MLTADSTRPCPICGAEQGTLAVTWRGAITYLWRSCVCHEAYIAAVEAREQARQAALARIYAQAEAANDLDVLAHQGLTLARFRRELLSGPPDEHPLDLAVNWLDAALAAGPYAVHTDAACPPALLYLTSPTRGCGKTHLATGLALAAQAAGQRVALVEEKRLLAAYWGASLEEQEQLLVRYGERTWLLVIDDLGRRPVRRHGHEETTSVGDVWDALLNRRYTYGGWTIITSNCTPTELFDRGTINSSTFSRIGQMTRRKVVPIQGEDQRMTTT
jgi:hypothetical protein